MNAENGYGENRQRHRLSAQAVRLHPAPSRGAAEYQRQSRLKMGARAFCAGCFFALSIGTDFRYGYRESARGESGEFSAGVAGGARSVVSGKYPCGFAALRQAGHLLPAFLFHASGYRADPGLR